MKHKKLIKRSCLLLMASAVISSLLVFGFCGCALAISGMCASKVYYTVRNEPEYVEMNS